MNNERSDKLADNMHNDRFAKLKKIQNEIYAALLLISLFFLIVT